MILSNREKLLISDQEFLREKIIVIDKIQELFEEVRRSIKTSITNSNYSFPQELDLNIGKIFKGENYNMLPYVNLDFPKYFNKGNIFTFRTMFWWGNFFSSTLHISGKYLKLYKDNIYQNLPNYLNQNIYIGVNNNPWEYNYNIDNYVLLTADNINRLENRNFIKLSKKYDLDDYLNLAKLVEEFFNNSLKILS